MEETSDTRDRLVETARKLFWEQGYGATGVAQILRESNTRSGSLYHFFPTKQDLLLAVLERYKELLWPEVMQPVFETVDDPIERVFAVLDGYRQGLVATGFTRGCPIGNLALELSDGKPQVRQLIAENFTGWMGQIRGCLDEAADRLPAHVDRQQLASFVLTVMEGAVMQCRAYQTSEPIETAVAQLREHFRLLLVEASPFKA
jgi:AcrR family transcriptional regulator